MLSALYYKQQEKTFNIDKNVGKWRGLLVDNEQKKKYIYQNSFAVSINI